MKTKSRLQVKVSTANRFREFSKKNNSNPSETLDLVLDFFEKNNLSPFETLVPSKVSLEQLIKKRIDAVIAILKNIEKTQTKPGLLMLELLMEGRSVPKPELIEKKKIASNNEKTQEQLELEISRLQEVLKATKKDLEYLLQHVEIKGNTFGADYLKLNIPRTAFEQFKIAIKHKV
ncbi:BfmA/BtgA family mobilization protein [Salegentibacter sp. F188]|uniref:BfmA/BtgA family mobilization protein n=1 Tax=Autumnicola patrickiae TaxID=3075591 RepID=A0ABU3DYD1_9FLAO|nr:BfmA/BtgA family mobilization protein [Salegentibacter sp. F188]MDT0688726.1 BfmA/BtgA family mobilization protein [Salegentibacter sp. F188]